MPNIFQQAWSGVSHAASDVGKVAGAAAHRVGAGVSHAVAHPAELVGDGLNGALVPASLTAQGVGGVMRAIGTATHDKGLVNAGVSVQRVTHEVQVSTERDPISSAEIIGGAAITVVGAVTGGALSTAGLALLGKGVGGIVKDVMVQEHQNGVAEAARAAAAAAAASGGAGGGGPGQSAHGAKAVPVIALAGLAALAFL